MRVRVVDLETSADGFPPEAGVCEIGFCDVFSTGRDLIGRPCGWHIHGPDSMLVNPGRPIAPQNSAIHHLIDALLIPAILISAALWAGIGYWLYVMVAG